MSTKEFIRVAVFIILLMVVFFLIGYSIIINKNSNAGKMHAKAEEIVEVRPKEYNLAEIYFEKSKESRAKGSLLWGDEVQYYLQLAIYYQNQEIIGLLKGMKK